MIVCGLVALLQDSFMLVFFHFIPVPLRMILPFLLFYSCSHSSLFISFNKFIGKLDRLIFLEWSPRTSRVVAAAPPQRASKFDILDTSLFLVLHYALHSFHWIM